jgi:malate dehydrogenase (oxaloacetate-decarboxylating)(NADP+)
VEATQTVFPRPLVQFEDFANRNAFRLLETYRERICTFDDDIQGTGSVALAGLLSALRVTGLPLKDQRVVFLGAGEAGVGIADTLVAALMEAGLPEGEARRRCWLLDSRGLVVASRDDLAAHKRPYAHDHEFLPDLHSAVEALRPTALIGVSGVPGTFDRSVVEAMARINERPVIFALSNPTSRSECTAEQAFAWSEGRALFASGSPFDPLEVGGRTLVPSQGNNAYIFPGVGLGVICCEATRVTDEMFQVAARALADEVSDDELAAGRLYPALERIRDVSAAIATAVAECAWQGGLARSPRPRDPAAFVRGKMYMARYRSYV